MIRIISMVEALCLHSYWVILFLILCAFGYEQRTKTIWADIKRLQAIQLQLQETKNDALQQREMILLRLNSQSDPRWIEMELMKGLGLVPKGQSKIIFSSDH